MTARKASEGIAFLRERTGGEKVTATVTFDQVYAKYQHESLDLRHPRGGRAKYLETPLFEGHDTWIKEFADGFLRVEEKTAGRRWGQTGRSLADAAAADAPDEFGDLRRSAGLVVKEGTVIILDEPPLQHRLTELELRDQDILRGRDY